MDSDIKVINTKLDYISAEISEVKGDVKEIKNTTATKAETALIARDLEKKVDKKEFVVVKSIVFGFVGVILMTIIVALIQLVVKS